MNIPWSVLLIAVTRFLSKADLLLCHWLLCCHRLVGDACLINVDTKRWDCVGANMNHESIDDDDCCWVSVVYRKSNHWQVLLADSCWLMCCLNDLALNEFVVALFVRPSFSEHDLLKTPIIIKKKHEHIIIINWWVLIVKRHNKNQMRFTGTNEKASVCIETQESLIVYGNLIFLLLFHSRSSSH